MNRTRSGTMSITASALLVSLVAAGCAGDSEAASGGGDKQSTFVIAVDGLTNTADNQSYSGIGHRIVFDTIKAPLLQYETLKENGGSVTSPEDMKPFLAEKYEIVDGGVQMTLRTAVSSAGNTLTAEDVKWTFERLYQVNDPVATGLAERAGIDPKAPVEVVDDKTFKINAKVNYLTLGILEGYQFFPLDSKDIKAKAGAADPWGKKYLTTHSATFGPYSISEFTPSESVTYTKNPNFTLFKPAWERVVMRHVPDAATRVSLLQTGQAQYIGQVGLEALAELRSDKRVNVMSTQYGGQDVLELVKTFKPFADERVREAISYAIDRKALAEGPYRGFAAPSTSVVSSAIATENSTADTYTFNPDRAKQLLAEAGQTNLKFTIYANKATMTGPLESVLTAVRQNLADVGVQVAIESVASPTDYRAAYAAGKYEAWVRNEGPLQVDAQYLLNLYHHSKATSNFMAQSDAVLDAAIDKAGALRGAERQAAIAPGIKQFNDVMLDVPLVETARGDVYSSAICPGDRNLSYVVQPQYDKSGPC